MSGGDPYTLTWFHLLGFIAFFAFILLLLSFIGGWQWLSRVYRISQRPSAKAHFFCSGHVGWVNYKGCLVFHVIEDGFFLSVIPICRIGHPPLFIPWHALHRVTEGRLIYLPGITYDIGNPRITTLTLSERLVERLGFPV